jgi:hypothetical protein
MLVRRRDHAQPERYLSSEGEVRSLKKDGEQPRQVLRERAQADLNESGQIVGVSEG